MAFPYQYFAPAAEARGGPFPPYGGAAIAWISASPSGSETRNQSALLLGIYDREPLMRQGQKFLVP